MPPTVDALDKRCLTCGYILDHLPAPRCPECGREFDPADAATFRVGGDRLPLIPLAAFALGAVALVLNLERLLDAPPPDVDWPALGLAAVALGVALVNPRPQGTRDGRHKRFAWLGVAARVGACICAVTVILIHCFLPYAH
jgi:hypothetical protein